MFYSWPMNVAWRHRTGWRAPEPRSRYQWVWTWRATTTGRLSAHWWQVRRGCRSNSRQPTSKQTPHLGPFNARRVKRSVIVIGGHFSQTDQVVNSVPSNLQQTTWSCRLNRTLPLNLPYRISCAFCLDRRTRREWRKTGYRCRSAQRLP